MASTPYDLAFRVERTNQTVCKKTLSADDLEKFRDVSHSGGCAVGGGSHATLSRGLRERDCAAVA